MAVLAAENGVRAGGMFGGINGNAFAGVGLHSCLAMAGKTGFVFVFILVGGGRGPSQG
jgi:hypothetical protein